MPSSRLTTSHLAFAAFVAVLLWGAAVGAQPCDEAARAPDDPFFDEQWALEQSSDADIDILRAWPHTTGSEAIVIAVLDGGIDRGHLDFEGRALPGDDVVEEDGMPDDDAGHGTHVSGIALAGADDGVGVAGVCPSCTLLPIKVLDMTTRLDCAVLVDGLQVAIEAEADVINISGGIPESQLCPELHPAVQEAVAAGIPIVAAMMNTGEQAKWYPAAFPETIAVGATDRDDARADAFAFGGGSNFGPWIDVVAPGVDVLGSLVRSEADAFPRSGTSQAVPMVAGAIGLLLSLDDTLDPERLRALITGSAEDLVGRTGEDVEGFDIYHGHGRLNVAQAVRMLACPDDVDGDGFSVPEDCDDRAAAVHPGAMEIVDNGRDDDCDPSTPDVPAMERTDTTSLDVTNDLEPDVAGGNGDSPGCCTIGVAARRHRF